VSCLQAYSLWIKVFHAIFLVLDFSMLCDLWTRWSDSRGNLSRHFIPPLGEGLGLHNHDGVARRASLPRSQPFIFVWTKNKWKNSCSTCGHKLQDLTHFFWGPVVGSPWNSSTPLSSKREHLNQDCTITVPKKVCTNPLDSAVD